ncbi:hypothetical protein [Streptomyces sp. NPDC048650]|uniref:hypothetical protein n=1 Tax=unclassified Streptomyces TaxID=2593676 RepID=UPI0037191059
MPARFTTATGHDSCHSVLPEMVAMAEQLSAVDKVLVMRRDAHPLYRNMLDGQGRWARRPGAAPALAAEQARPYTDDEAARFWAVQRWLHTMVPQYRNDLIAVAGPACPLMPARQPRQLNNPAAAAALPVFA